MVSGESVLLGRPSGASSSPHRHAYHPCCYRCHLKHKLCLAPNASIGSSVGPKLPWLQLSLSQLGFSDFEFEIALNSAPRKVILRWKRKAYDPSAEAAIASKKAGVRMADASHVSASAK